MEIILAGEIVDSARKYYGGKTKKGLEHSIFSLIEKFVKSIS
jgi:hypothetical protein